MIFLTYGLINKKGVRYLNSHYIFKQINLKLDYR